MSTGLPDSAVLNAHYMIHHAEQEEHEHEAAAKRGLTDNAAEAEHDFMQHAEDELEEYERNKKASKVKKVVDKITPGKK
ncbi:hypothetical protein GGS21DRAFT_238251 [Xylaria nigripes]|nr:hypothetical protein GGS21DRAFT_238251 [Xylaria nigripes]